jgi:hypothetical protein
MTPARLPARPPRRFTCPAALLLFVAPLFPPPFPPVLGAQSPPELRLQVESFPENPVSGGSWTLILLVDHPRPQELEVRPPPFPPGLILEARRREPRLVGDERWTALEYRFTLQGSGRLDLGPFEITGPRSAARSAPLSLDIPAPAKTGERRFQLVWEYIPSRLAAGEAVEFSLGIPGWDTRRPMPAAALLLPPTPPGCILEALELRPGDAEAGRVLRLRLISLSGGRFTLPRRTVRVGDLLLDIPALEIPAAEMGPL